MTHRLTMMGSRGNAISVTASGSGPALMLLHGFPLDQRMWQHQLSGLSDAYQVLSMDLSGFGQSALVDEDYRVGDLAEDVEIVRRHLAPERPIAVCGLSMGGYVAFEYWQRYRSRLGALILAHTRPAADTTQQQQARLAMAEAALQGGTWAVVEGMLPKLLSSSTCDQQPEVASFVAKMMRECAPSAIAAAQRAMASRSDFSDQLPLMDIPVLTVAGAQDTLAPVGDTERWTARLPQGNLATIEQAAHLSPVECPDEFSTCVRTFLQSHDMPSG